MSSRNATYLAQIGAALALALLAAVAFLRASLRVHQRELDEPQSDRLAPVTEIRQAA